MLAISARIEVASKDIAAYIAAAQSIIEPTHAEPGCHLYAIAVDINLPNVSGLPNSGKTTTLC